MMSLFIFVIPENETNNLLSDLHHQEDLSIYRKKNI